VKVAIESDIRIIDQQATEKYQVPSLILMENAGIALARCVAEHIKENQRTFIVVGMGNNGGDGMVCARHLHNQGYEVIVFLIGNTKKLSVDANLNFEMLKPLNIRIETINDVNGAKKLSKMIVKDDVVVDCIFGIGIKRPVEGVYQFAIEAINESKGYVVSCDLPSGIRADDGHVMGTAIKANQTIAMCLPKVGNIFYPAADYNGVLTIETIGIPRSLLMKLPSNMQLITREDVVKIIPRRHMDTHKGTYGKATLVAGSFGMTGAAILSAKASLRAGVGLLKLVIPESLHTILTTSVPEAVILPLTETRRGVFGINQIDKLISSCKGSNVVAIGPGCGKSAEMIEIIRQLITEVDLPLVIDADGINTLAKNIGLLENHTREVILTPHPGEMSRLTGLTIEEINEKPIEVAKAFAEKWQVTLVLKGARTIVALKNGEIHLNVNGNPGMATAGSGDVLTGIITSLVAQGIAPEQAAIAGVFIHGYAGDVMVKSKGEYGLIAGDLVEGISIALCDVMACH